MNLRGTLPTLILEAIERHPDHGYSIAQRIRERSSGVLDFKEGPFTRRSTNWNSRALWNPMTTAWRRVARAVTTELQGGPRRVGEGPQGVG